MSIFKKGNSYYIDYYFFGSRKRECIGTDRKLAETVLAKRKVEIAEGKFLDVRKESSIRLNEIFDDFLEYSRNAKRSYWRDLILARHLKEFFGNKYLTNIIPSLIEAYRGNRLNTDGIANSTINREVAFLKASFNLAIRNKKATENPVRYIKKLSEPDGRVEYLRNDEISRLLNACDKHLRVIVICALTTGMRKSEILNLKWKDVDMSKGMIHLTDTKNGRNRNIPICGLLHRTLQECFEWSNGIDAFCSSKGRKYSHKDSIKTPWKNTLERAGINNFRFHDLRHTAASYLVMLGIDLVTVKEILGHRTLDMTLRYAHLGKSHVREAVEILGSKMDTFWTPKGKEASQIPVDNFKASSEKD